MASKLQDKRLAAGLSQSQLAEKANVNYRVLQCYEQGTKKIDRARLDTIYKLAIALDCTVSDLIEDNSIVELINQYENRI